MKAIVVREFGDESVLRVEEIPTPEPRVGEVRVKIAATGVNPVETYIRSGKYGRLPALPYTPGNDGAGVVDAVGPEVRGVAAGDRVFIAAALAKRTTGTYAEYSVCDADAVRPLPAETSFAQGAGIATPGLAAIDALFSRGKVQPGDRVLVHGATGGVGTLAVQYARKAGAIVFGTAGTEEGVRLIAGLGAHEAFNHNEAGYVEKISCSFDGSGLDVIVEMLANVNLGKDLSLIAPRGRIVIVGSRGSVEFNPRDAMAKDAAVIGMMLTNMTREERAQNMARLTAGLENGVKILVGREFPLAEAAQAHRAVMAEGKSGKIVLAVGE